MHQANLRYISLKIVALLLVMLIMLANSVTVISYAVDNALTESEIESQGTKKNNRLPARSRLCNKT